MSLPILHHIVDQSRTKYLDSAEKPIAASTAEILEGFALVAAPTPPSGEEEAQLCTGAANEANLFMGMSIVQVVKVLSLPLVEFITVPSAGPMTVALQKVPVGGPIVAQGGAPGGTLSAYIGAAPMAYVAGAPAINNYDLVGNVLTFNVLNAAAVVNVYYIYQPTLIEVLSRFHQSSINYENANALLEKVSIGRGIGSEIFLQQYDLSQGRFANIGDPVFLGGASIGTTPGMIVAANANGNTTIGRVTKLPTAEDPYLGFRLTV